MSLFDLMRWFFLINFVGIYAKLTVNPMVFVKRSSVPGFLLSEYVPRCLPSRNVDKLIFADAVVSKFVVRSCNNHCSPISIVNERHVSDREIKTSVQVE